MNGYVKNKSTIWRYAFKRRVEPGGVIELDELYKQYGDKHGINQGQEFVEWLKNVKMKYLTGWGLVFDDDEKINGEVSQLSSVPHDGLSKSTESSTKRKSVEDVVNMSVRVAKEELSRITDIKLLKYAHSHARQLPGKNTLCLMLSKRIQELQLLS